MGKKDRTILLNNRALSWIFTMWFPRELMGRHGQSSFWSKHTHISFRRNGWKWRKRKLAISKIDSFCFELTHMPFTCSPFSFANEKIKQNKCQFIYEDIKVKYYIFLFLPFAYPSSGTCDFYLFYPSHIQKYIIFY